MYDQKAVDDSDLLQSDTFVSEQYREILSSQTLDPEKRLMLAILEDAVKCFQASSDFTGDWPAGKGGLSECQ